MEVEPYEVIRKRVEQRFQQRYAFYAHVAVYTLVNLVLWLVYGLTSNVAWQIATRLGLEGLVPILTFPWPLLIMAFWGIGLVAHGLNYYIRYGDGAVRRQAAIDRAVERELTEHMAFEKPKNDQHLRLTDDGELEAVEDEPAWPMKRKHRS